MSLDARRLRQFVLCGLIFVHGFLAAPQRGCNGPRETIARQEGFRPRSVGERYVPWGHNYASVDIMERLAKAPARVKRDFAEMKAAGATVVPGASGDAGLSSRPRQGGPRSAGPIVAAARNRREVGRLPPHHGLACYKIKDRLAWYDKLDDEARWKVQEFFLVHDRQNLRQRPGCFCYDLVNEPAAAGKRRGRLVPSAGWVMSSFVNALRSTRPGKRLGRRHLSQMDPPHGRRDPPARFCQMLLITLGMLPFPARTRRLLEQLDFVSRRVCIPRPRSWTRNRDFSNNSISANRSSSARRFP